MPLSASSGTIAGGGAPAAINASLTSCGVAGYHVGLCGAASRNDNVPGIITPSGACGPVYLRLHVLPVTLTSVIVHPTSDHALDEIPASHAACCVRRHKASSVPPGLYSKQGPIVHAVLSSRSSCLVSGLIRVPDDESHATASGIAVAAHPMTPPVVQPMTAPAMSPFGMVLLMSTGALLPASGILPAACTSTPPPAPGAAP